MIHKETHRTYLIRINILIKIVGIQENSFHDSHSYRNRKQSSKKNYFLSHLKVSAHAKDLLHLNRNMPIYYTILMKFSLNVEITNHI